MVGLLSRFWLLSLVLIGVQDNAGVGMIAENPHTQIGNPAVTISKVPARPFVVPGVRGLHSSLVASNFIDEGAGNVLNRINPTTIITTLNIDFGGTFSGKLMMMLNDHFFLPRYMKGAIRQRIFLVANSV